MLTSAIGFDTETYRIQRGLLCPPLVCLTLASREPLGLPAGPGVILSRQDAEYTALLDAERAAECWPILLASGRPLVAHRASYDLAVLMSASGAVDATLAAVERGQVWDTYLRERLLYIALGVARGEKYSLADLVFRYFDIDISESKTDPQAWRLRYGSLAHVPVEHWPRSAAEYALMDAVYALRCGLKQSEAPATVAGYPFKQPDGRLPHEVRETCAALALHLAAVWSMRTERAEVFRTFRRWRKDALRGIEVGKRGGWVRTEGKRAGSVDKKVLGELVSRAYDGAPPRTEKGAVRTATEVLMTSGDPALVEYAECLQGKSYLTRYMPALIQGLTAPVTYSVNSLLNTGRVSVSNPPLHQSPRTGGFRECFVARPNRLFVSADYTAIELYALAEVLELRGHGTTLADALRGGLDPHALMAADILSAERRAPPAPHTAWDHALVTRCIAGDYGAEWGTLAAQYRQLAKAANFGFAGGLGATEFTRYVGGSLPFERAAMVRELWLRRWPEMRSYFAAINLRLSAGGSYTERQEVSGRLRGACGYTDGANTLFQGLVADGCKWSAWLVQRECLTAREASPLHGARLVLTLHDELIAEVLEDRASDAAHRIAELMVSGMQEYIRSIPIKVAPVIMRRWYKGAKPVYENGCLVPWEP